MKDPGKFEKDYTWWHVQYTLPKTAADGEHASIVRNQKDITDVLADMSEINEDTILVYASDAAFSASPLKLSAKLETFVKKDNVSFQQEVAAAQAEWLNAAGQDPYQNGQTVEDWMADDGWGNGGDAKQGYQQDTFGSTLSSKTLTPSTDPNNPPTYPGDDGVVDITLSPERESDQPMEMQEINGGISAWAGNSNASSETVGLEPLETLEPMSDVVVNDGRESRAAVHVEDLVMGDTDTSTNGEVKHIEIVEKKGG